MQCPNCGLINPESAQRCDCGYDFVSKAIKEPYLKEQIDPSLRGFGGWLLLFWYGMAVATPLFALVEASMGSYSGPAVAVVTVALVLAFSAFCVYAGVGLRRLWPRSLKLVKAYLVACLVIGWLPLVFAAAGFYKPASLADRPLLQGAFYPILWWFYFKKSKRVRAVFGRNF